MSSEPWCWWEPGPFAGTEVASLGGMQNSGILSGVSTLGKAAAPRRPFSSTLWPGGSPRKAGQGRLLLSWDALIFSKNHIAVASLGVLGGKSRKHKSTCRHRNTKVREHLPRMHNSKGGGGDTASGRTGTGAALQQADGAERAKRSHSRDPTAASPV